MLSSIHTSKQLSQLALVSSSSNSSSSSAQLSSAQLFGVDTEHSAQRKLFTIRKIVTASVICGRILTNTQLQLQLQLPEQSRPRPSRRSPSSAHSMRIYTPIPMLIPIAIPSPCRASPSPIISPQPCCSVLVNLASFIVAKAKCHAMAKTRSANYSLLFVPLHVCVRVCVCGKCGKRRDSWLRRRRRRRLTWHYNTQPQPDQMQ